MTTIIKTSLRLRHCSRNCLRRRWASGGWPARRPWRGSGTSWNHSCWGGGGDGGGGGGAAALFCQQFLAPTGGRVDHCIGDLPHKEAGWPGPDCWLHSSFEACTPQKVSKASNALRTFGRLSKCVVDFGFRMYQTLMLAQKCCVCLSSYINFTFSVVILVLLVWVFLFTLYFYLRYI